MIVLKKSKYFFYLISLSLHVLILSCMLIFFDKQREVSSLNGAIEHTIESYIDTESHFTKASMTTSKNEKVVSKNIIKFSKQPMQKKIKKQLMSQTSTDKHPSSSQTSGRAEMKNELLTLLHTAIQNHQHYPLMAMEMERQGRTTVGFILFPDGSIKNLHMVQSSGTQSLDQAALEAVQNAAPFKEIHRFLDSAQAFNIDVVFELA